MLFNSFQFLLFFPLTVLIYFILPNKYRWIFLLVASYYFYMNWKPVYALLIFTSTFITWACSLLMESTSIKRKKKLYLIFSLLINFSILFLYKYFNFVNESILHLLDAFNVRWSVPNFDILLPVGISFYSFQAVGYTIDVYRGDLKAEKNLGIYALFVSFFPQLVAGPIERTSSLLPQFYEFKRFQIGNFKEGISLMIWGYFMKTVISDRLGLYVDAAYNNIDDHNGSTLLLATFFFSFQIYCDFAGYSNIAIGASKIMGYDLMTNFKRPYFALNISEFWHRWHISLSTWFRDYLYIPLGGNKVSKRRGYFNVFITFLVSGIWHGANWTFFIWGALHGFYISVQKYFKIDKIFSDEFNFSYFIFSLINFVLVSFAWIFFRANNLSDAITVIFKIFSNQGSIHIGSATTFIFGIAGLSLLLLREIRQEFFTNRYLILNNTNDIISAFSLSVLVIIILSIGVFNGGQFIYFQF
jgi:alginate O-acetyltransferase complex protein AlgI